jgi:hypothetical protein
MLEFDIGIAGADFRDDTPPLSMTFDLSIEVSLPRRCRAILSPGKTISVKGLAMPPVPLESPLAYRRFGIR